MVLEKVQLTCSGLCEAAGAISGLVGLESVTFKEFDMGENLESWNMFFHQLNSSRIQNYKVCEPALGEARREASRQMLISSLVRMVVSRSACISIQEGPKDCLEEVLKFKKDCRITELFITKPDSSFFPLLAGNKSLRSLEIEYKSNFEFTEAYACELVDAVVASNLTSLVIVFKKKVFVMCKPYTSPGRRFQTKIQLSPAFEDMCQKLSNFRAVDPLRDPDNLFDEVQN